MSGCKLWLTSAAATFGVLAVAIGLPVMLACAVFCGAYL